MDEVARVPGTDTIRICGVTYDLALFRALAARLGAGARCELFRKHDGRLDMYAHRPQPQTPSGVSASKAAGIGDDA